MTVDGDYSRRREFFGGAKATFPLIVGAIPFGIIFGALAATKGLSPAGAAAMSAFVFAGSAQFIALSLIGGGASAALVIVTTFVVNLRHALYSATLAPAVRHLPQRWLIPLGFGLTDESFIVVVQRYEQPDASPYKHWFFLGSVTAMYASWQVCTWLGIVAGQRIPNPAAWGLDFAMSVTFIGMLVPMITTRPIAVSVVVAGLVALLADGLPNQLGLMVGALSGIGAGMLAQTMNGTPLPTALPEPDAGP